MLLWLTALVLAQPMAQAFPQALPQALPQGFPQALSQAVPEARLQVPSQAVTQIVPPSRPPVEQVVPQTVRPLPGQLDNIPVFNSNSPELVAEPGILLSTFPPAGMAVPEAHLNFPFQGRFDVFAHHVYKAADYDSENPILLDSLYLGVLVHNPGEVAVNVRVLAGASYLSQPDAPFIPLSSFLPFGPRNPVYAGPGSRVMGDILQERRSDIFPGVMTLAPGESAMLMNQPISIRELDPPINGRSTLAKLESSGPVYVASLAQPVGLTESGNEIPPSLASWQEILQQGGLAGPRDLTPSALPLEEGISLIYGRVAGVSEGAQWEATLTDPIDDLSTQASTRLTIPSAGEAFSYGVSLLYAGTMGTGQIQSAPMLVRYPDTAYQAHGNYGVRYSLRLPLYNPMETEQTVRVALQTPIKEEVLSAGGLRFFTEEAPQTFFRGPVQVRYQSDRAFPVVRNIHLVQKRGQPGEPLATITLAPNTSRMVSVDLLYPPDSTPPQVLTVETLP